MKSMNVLHTMVKKCYVLGKPGGSIVVVCNAVHCGNCLGLPPTGEQELWRFIEVEKEESANEHGKRDRSEGENKIAPAPVISFGAWSTGSTRKVGNKRPCN